MNNASSASTVSVDAVSVDMLLDRGNTPFTTPGLHADVASHILEHAKHFPLRNNFRINVSVPEKDMGQAEVVQLAIHHHFRIAEVHAARELSEIWRDGRIATMIGLLFMSFLLGIGQIATSITGNEASRLVTESMTVFGWVSMWRPAELLLYDHWPVRRNRILARQLAKAEVVLIPRPEQAR